MRVRMVVLGVLAVGCASESGLEAERDLLSARVAELEGELATVRAEKAALEEERAVDDGSAEVREALGLSEGEALHATLETGLGDIRCELWPEVAPKTVQNFVGLAEGTREWTDPRTRETRTDPLYEGTVFHRVIPGFMIQGGDPLGTGRGGPGYRFEDEVRDDVVFDEPGLLAMANAGPNTNGSQFFITDGTPRHLDGRHTIFGRCDREVVQAILAQPLQPVPRGQPSQPEEPVTLERVVVERG